MTPYHTDHRNQQTVLSVRRNLTRRQRPTIQPNHTNTRVSLSTRLLQLHIIPISQPTPTDPIDTSMAIDDDDNDDHDTAAAATVYESSTRIFNHVAESI